jgi:hypothetical protein
MDMLNFLSKHSIIGMVAGVGSSIITYINGLEPYIKAFGFITGIIIALLTIYAKILEIKERKARKAHKH